MGIDYQVHRVSVDMSKGFRQLQKADNELANDHVDSAVNHLARGLDLFGTAMDHLAKAEDDASNKASAEIDKGDKELQKSIDEYSGGNIDSAAKHYASALDSYDEALALLG